MDGQIGSNGGESWGSAKVDGPERSKWTVHPLSWDRPIWTSLVRDGPTLNEFQGIIYTVIEKWISGKRCWRKRNAIIDNTQCKPKPAISTGHLFGLGQNLFLTDSLKIWMIWRHWRQWLTVNLWQVQSTRLGCSAMWQSLSPDVRNWPWKNPRNRKKIYRIFLNVIFSKFNYSIQIALSKPFQTDSWFEKLSDSFFLEILIVFILIHIFAKLEHLCRNFFAIEFRDSFYSFEEGFKPDSQSCLPGQLVCDGPVEGPDALSKPVKSLSDIEPTFVCFSFFILIQKPSWRLDQRKEWNDHWNH